MRQRAETFREVDCLVQKYFVHDETNDRYDASSIFESTEARDAYFESELSASVGVAYALQGEAAVTKAHLLFPVREAEDLPAPA